ncbi:GtrA family protein [Saccharopolyspora sp. TS4A08]|uniref:GtrA family protein n=1 Tax=Saccharopolyspora ipomoeae TaxID=3042027 RepID=A0ABT6PW53_9PSEU|nr:GtrA family protein [Saccharopolyspora sp. TS4A08]MDI2032070.1 GtrA family protein [Saccharopolyspora sp. TS4A08]
MAETATEPKKLGVFNQLVRFIAIGGGCAIIDFGTYSLMLGVLGWPFWLSRGISFILGTSASYVINRKLTFQGANTGNTKAKAGAFALVYIVTFFVNWGTNQLLVVWTGADEPWLVTVCWVVGQGLGTLINFVMLKWVVFRE